MGGGGDRSGIPKRRFGRFKGHGVVRSARAGEGGKLQRVSLCTKLTC